MAVSLLRFTERLISLAAVLLLTLPAATHAQSGSAMRAASASEGAVVQRAWSGRRVALLIGNSAYTKLDPLANPKSDLRLIEATLRELGFNEIVGGTQKGMDVSAGDMQELLSEEVTA